MTVKEKEQKIKELHERLDWYYDCSLDEEFDTDEVISLLHQLDQLEPIEPPPQKSDEQMLADFWMYVREREEEERILRDVIQGDENKKT